MAVNTPLSFKDITIQITIEHFISYLRDSSKVLNGQHRYVIVASELMFPFINIITHHFRKSERKTLLQIIPTNGKTRLKVEFVVTFFTTINLFFVGEHLTRSGEVENSEMIKKILKRQLFYSFLFLFFYFFFFSFQS